MTPVLLVTLINLSLPTTPPSTKRAEKSQIKREKSTTFRPDPLRVLPLLLQRVLKMKMKKINIGEKNSTPKKKRKKIIQIAKMMKKKKKKFSIKRNRRSRAI